MTEEGSFINYWDELDRLFKELYSVDTFDLGLSADEIAEAQESGDSPSEFVEWYANKHALVLRGEMTLERAKFILGKFKSKEGN